MRTRRQLFALTGGAFALPFTAQTQQSANVARIGVLGPDSTSSWAKQMTELRSGLRNLGYVEGKNLVMVFRWADDQYDRLPALATDLVRLNVDVLVTYGTPGTLAAKRATATIPIVMAYTGDAVAAGLVANLAQPGGNVTGSSAPGDRQEVGGASPP